MSFVRCTGTVAVQINMPRQWSLVAEILYTCSDCNCKNDHRHQAEVNRREAQRRGSDLDIARSRTGAAAGNRAGHLLRLTIPASTKSIIKPVYVRGTTTTHLCQFCSVLVVKLVNALHD